MSLLVVALVAIAIYIAGYVLYGGFLSRVFGVDDKRVTPAVRINDGVDHVPTSPPILLGQHFASIAAVAPIVGPIVAGLAHGWVPGLLWILLGAVFIGGTHDFAALIASIRHEARSVGELVRQYISPTGYILFLAFVWLSLTYVVVVFADLTAAAFVAPEYGPGVATSSMLYLLLAAAMGLALYKARVPLWLATLIFLPLVCLVIWGGQKIPVEVPAIAGSPAKTWDLIILGYCFVASIIPLWLLMQPRGYLGSFFLYAMFAAGLIGIFLGGATIQFPARLSSPLFGFTVGGTPPVFPLLFTTIACGACSGFHALVSSGTSSKQLRRERDARPVAYGAMLLEGIVAVVALSTVMMLAPGDARLKLAPDEIYARGLAQFLGVIGIPVGVAITFGKLAFATFIYDTLDVATRLGRYVLQELTGWKGRRGAVLATLGTLLVPAIAVFYTLSGPDGKPLPLWKVFWPVFGASNQLLAALALVGLTVWMRAEGRQWVITAVPALFMAVITLWSLALQAYEATTLRPSPIIAASALVLIALAVVVLYQGVRAFLRVKPTALTAPERELAAATD
ncbi:MAG: carbon starvation protein A [Armatimonadetes bacterium]|nr:carbon starvation protein A [Armatimonadota bacterium]